MTPYYADWGSLGSSDENDSDDDCDRRYTKEEVDADGVQHISFQDKEGCWEICNSGYPEQDLSHLVDK